MTEVSKPERQRKIHAAIALIVVGAALFLLQVMETAQRFQRGQQVGLISIVMNLPSRCL